MWTKRAVTTPTNPPTSKPFDQLVGDRLFLDGVAPIARDGTVLWPGDVDQQLTQCLAQVEQAIGRVRRPQETIRSLTIYVVGRRKALQQAWNTVDAWHAPSSSHDGRRPAITIVGTTRLRYKGQVVEIGAEIFVHEDGLS
jgi:enamine deaminase RidA (YjgF/YER057c/UK114 family)